MLSLETALHFVYDVIHVDVKKIFHVILGQINKLASYLLLICRQKKVKRLVRKPHLQDLVPRLAEKKIWMHLVQEIMIMEMNLMTLCENDAANQVHRRIWNLHSSVQINTDVDCVVFSHFLSIFVL